MTAYAVFAVAGLAGLPFALRAIIHGCRPRRMELAEYRFPGGDQ